MNFQLCRWLFLLAGAAIFLPLYRWLRYRYGPGISFGRTAVSQQKPQITKEKDQEESVRLQRVDGGSADDCTHKKIDIIAIHGLDTKSPDTWTCQEKNRCVNWLADADMLPNKFPEARIYTCDWPARMFREKTSIELTFQELARSLLHAISTRPGSSKNRPILFVASCLGGITLIQSLVEASRPGSKYASVWNDCGGVIFLATPFRGTAFGDMARFSVGFINAYAELGSQDVSDLLGSVQDTTPFLNDLVACFTSAWGNREKANLTGELATFYERRPGNLYRKVLPWIVADWIQKPKPLVSQDSARLDIDSSPIGLDRSHVMMNKFGSPDDVGFQVVVGAMKNIVEKIIDGQPMVQADRWIRRHYYSPERLAIQRLSGDALPIGQCYINLSLNVHGSKSKRLSKLLFKPTSDPISTLSSAFTPALRPEMESLNAEKKIRLCDIFQKEQYERCFFRPRRIFIRGRAGVGKTTLCKKIVHECIYTGMWSHMFDRVLWMPLRQLKSWEAHELDLEKRFYKEYFRENHAQHDGLVQALCNAPQDRTLFLLDGLDEIYQQWNRDDPRYKFLLRLLNKTNVIITSRPHVQLDSSVDALDIELDTVGFYEEQIGDYVRAALKDTEKSTDVENFLQDRPLLKELSRIPIQLDALCFIWDKGINGASPDTMTSLYQKIELGLWKKDVVRLKKRVDGEPLTGTLLMDASQKSVENYVSDELSFLEALAFAGLCGNIIDFQTGHRDKVFEHFHLNTHVDTELPSLSFLRPSESLSDDKAYHFIHLTYQEYFAARYFSSHWTKHCRKGEKEEKLEILLLEGDEFVSFDIVEFLYKNKYNPHYDMFWRFVAGILKGRSQDVFFATLEEQQDLLGLVHPRLIVHCLAEAPKNLRARDSLENKLAQWILFECRTRNGSTLANTPEIPDRSFSLALQHSEKVDALFRLISPRNKTVRLKRLGLRFLSNPNISEPSKEEIVCRLVKDRIELSNAGFRDAVALLQGGDNPVKWTVLYVLKHQKKIPKDVVHQVVLQLSNEDLGYEAQKILGDKIAVPNGAISHASWQALVAMLDDIADRKCAASILRARDLPRAVVDTIRMRMNDSSHDGGYRELAAQLLICQDEMEANSQASAEGLHSTEAGNEFQTQVVVSRAEGDDGLGVECVATKVSRPDLSYERLLKILALLESGEDLDRMDAIDVLRKCEPLSKELLNVVVKRLEDSETGSVEAALKVLGTQRTISEEVLEAMAARLGDDNSQARVLALGVLAAQEALPTKLVDVVAELLQGSNTTTTVSKKAHRLLGPQGELSDRRPEVGAAGLADDKMAIEILHRGKRHYSDKVLQAVVTRMESSDDRVVWMAASIVRRQKGLSESVLGSIAQLSLSTHRVAQAVGWVLGAHNNLPEDGIRLLDLMLAAYQLRRHRRAVWYAAQAMLVQQDMLQRDTSSAVYLRRLAPAQKISAELSRVTTCLRWHSHQGFLIHEDGVFRKEPFQRAHYHLLFSALEENISWTIKDGVSIFRSPNGVFERKIDERQVREALRENSWPEEYKDAHEMWLQVRNP